jgi:DNA-binding CsgD family transcriptional regulator
MNESHIALLEKTVMIQNHILEGHSVKAVLRKETKSFKEQSGADIIAICVGDENFVSIEMVMEEKRRFAALLREYKLSSQHMFLNKFKRYYKNHYEGTREYLLVDSLHKIFDGTFTQVKAFEFEEALNFSEAYIFPIRSKSNRKIGFVIYIFTHENIPNITNMADITTMFESLIRPFYNMETSTFHSKCVHVDNKMDILTDKEKQVVFRILHGRAYKEIANELNVTINTVKTHTKNIFSKYGVSSKMELQNKMMGNF